MTLGHCGAAEADACVSSGADHLTVAVLPVALRRSRCTSASRRIVASAKKSSLSAVEHAESSVIRPEMEFAMEKSSSSGIGVPLRRVASASRVPT